MSEQGRIGRKPNGAPIANVKKRSERTFAEV